LLLITNAKLTNFLVKLNSSLLKKRDKKDKKTSKLRGNKNPTITKKQLKILLD
jgi:hypothetical protein